MSAFVFCAECMGASVDVLGWEGKRATLRCSDCDHEAQIEGFTVGRVLLDPQDEQGRALARPLNDLLALAQADIALPRVRRRSRRAAAPEIGNIHALRGGGRDMPREKEVITLSGQAAHLVVNQQGATLTVNLPGLTEGIKLGMGELVVVLSESDWDHVLASFRSLKEESAIPRLESERDHFQAQAREFELRAVEAEEQVEELEGKLEDAEGERDELRVFIAALQAQVKDLKERMEHVAPPRCGCDAAYLGMAVREIDSLLTDIYGIHKIDENNEPMSLADRIVWLASKAGFKDPFPRAKEGGGA